MMEELFVEETDTTPQVHFQPEEGSIEIKGISIPEDAEAFYNPILEDLKAYIEDEPKPQTNVLFKLVYINTGTSAMIAKLIKIVEALDEKENCEINISWYYEEEDEDMKDLGDYFSSFTELIFDFVPMEEIE
jgi:hypothetical protein